MGENEEAKSNKMNPAVAYLFLRIVIAFFEYIKTFLLTPVIVGFFGWIVVASIMVSGANQDLNPLNPLFKLMSWYWPEKTNFGNSEIIQVFGFISLAFYLIEVVLRKYLGLSLSLSLKKKMILYLSSMSAVILLTMLFAKFGYYSKDVPYSTIIFFGFITLVYGAFSLNAGHVLGWWIGIMKKMQVHIS